MRSVLTSPAAKGLYGGVIGVVTALLSWHLYTDHVAFHQALDFLTANAAKLAKLP